MNKTVNFIFFIAGAVVGSFITYRFIKGKYEQIAQEEIDSVKEVFYKRNSSDTCKKKTDEKDIKAQTSIPDYESRLHTHGYTNYSDNSKPTRETAKEDRVGGVYEPHVIPPEEFGDIDDYETYSLTYYADKVLANDCDELIDIGVVGEYSLLQFGEYEDDSVYVRNDDIECYYEINRDLRKYSDVVRNTEE